MDSSALLDAAVRSPAASAEQEAKVSPVPVVKNKKASLSAKLKSPAAVSRAKKFSFDKTTADKGIVQYNTVQYTIQYSFNKSCQNAT